MVKVKPGFFPSFTRLRVWYNEIVTFVGLSSRRRVAIASVTRAYYVWHMDVESCGTCITYDNLDNVLRGSFHSEVHPIPLHNDAPSP